MSIRVSVVVPTYQRPHYLARCLEALLSQNFRPDEYEILVVHDGEEGEGTRNLVASFPTGLRVGAFSQAMTVQVPQLVGIPLTGSPSPLALLPIDLSVVDRPAVRYLTVPGRRGPAAARNLGWREAEGEIIAFTDDDCIPHPDWLANGVSAFVGEVAAVSGRVIVPLSPTPTDNEINTTGLERSDFVTANCFYQRQALIKAGGFDERFRTAWREDSDLYFTLREMNAHLAWASNAVVYHPARPEAWGSSLRQQKKSIYNALLYKKHPRLYRRFIQSSPPWHYYGMFFGLALAGVGIAYAQTGLAAAGLLVWLSLLLRFILQRLQHASRSAAHILEMVITSIAIPFLSIYWRIRGAVRWKVFFF